MIELPLRLGPLCADGYGVSRSGIRWLIQPGQYCRANQIFAYCNISLEATGIRMSGAPPFAEEMELQVALRRAAPAGYQAAPVRNLVATLVFAASMFGTPVRSSRILKSRRSQMWTLKDCVS